MHFEPFKIMKAKDWFRRNNWTKEDQEDFFSHLRRARSHNRGQYLRIQASHLEETGTKINLQAALDLLDIVIKEYPHPVQLEIAYYQRATCLELLNRLDEAVASYQEAFQARCNKPNVHTYAPLYFGMFAVRHNRTDLYEEVLAIFNEFVNDSDIVFPDAKYMFFTANAIIYKKYGQESVARECAKKALLAASLSYSGLSRHPDVGLVKSRDKALENKLQRIVNPGFISRLKNKQ